MMILVQMIDCEYTGRDEFKTREYLICKLIIAASQLPKRQVY
jgi:hypothetical protein